MPNQPGAFIPIETLSLAQRLETQGRYQEAWYRFGALFVQDRRVLDVGAADGYGMDLLKAMGAKEVHGVDPLPLREDVQPTRIEDIASGQYDVSIACDVIEHVLEDRAFFQHLLRVATIGTFLTTPNWNFFGPRTLAMNRFHAREYTPTELKDLLAGCSYQVWLADAFWTITPRPELQDQEQACNFGVWVTK